MTAGAIEQLCRELMASRERIEALPGFATSQRLKRLSRLLARLQARLGRPPRIVLLGEFNSGKSTLANALIGADVLPTSIHANTRIPIHVHYHKESTINVELADGSRRRLDEESIALVVGSRARMLHVGLAVERLKTFELIDTPGLASGVMRLDEMTLDACRHASIALWCTASTQAWKATERSVWDAVPARLHRNGLLVATLADTLNTDRDRSRVKQRLEREAAPTFAAMVMVAAAEIDELRRDPEAPDHSERWVSSGGEALDKEVLGLVDRVLAERTDAAQRVLQRSADRAEQASPAGAA